MNRLIAELTRLYFLPGQEWQTWQLGDAGERVHVTEGVLTPEIFAARLATESNIGLSLVSQKAMVRTMVIGFDRGSYWDELANLYQCVQEDFDFPAPAISVSVEDGYQIWFSLAEPVPLEQAQAFLDALRRKYLTDIPVARIKFRPGIEGRANGDSPGVLPLMQVLKEPAERWSAFIDPSMGSMFIDEPWLDMAPNLDSQASMLAVVQSIRADDFQRALNTLTVGSESDVANVQSLAASDGDQQVSSPGVLGSFADPKRFLMAVMNDRHASVCDRIEAAKALLPYFEHLKVK